MIHFLPICFFDAFKVKDNIIVILLEISFSTEIIFFH